MRRLMSPIRLAQKGVLLCLACLPIIVLLRDANKKEPSRGQANQVYDEDFTLSRLIPQVNSKGEVGSEAAALLEAADADMAHRRTHLQEACKETELDQPGNDTLHSPNPWEFLINHPYKLVWCNVFKSASTSWMYNFNLLAGYSPKFLKKTREVPLQLARRKYPRPTVQDLREAMNDSLSFLIVRHPFERLLSAYRDKIQRALPHSVHDKLGAKIVSKYRAPGAEESKDLLKHRSHRGHLAGPKWPTFAEFTNYLIDSYYEGAPFDMHWAPITTFCTPCQLQFKVIAKFETLQRDQNYIILAAGLQEKIRPEWKNPSRGKRTTMELVNEYYSQLTKDQISDLYDIYRYDFELFDYTLEQVGLSLDPLQDTIRKITTAKP